MADLDQINDDLLDEEDEDTMEGKYLAFNLENEVYGIGIKYVQEIIGIQSITKVPEMPNFIKGVINLRGKVIPVMDVRTRFKLESKKYDDRTCIIVILLGDFEVGLIVDIVSEVVAINLENIDNSSFVSQHSGARFIEGLGKIDGKVIILLNVEKLLREKEMEQLSSSLKNN